MKLRLLGGLLAAMMSASLPAAPNLAGVWTLDAAKSTASLSATCKRLTLEIEQRQGEIEVVWLMESDERWTVWVENLVPSRQEKAFSMQDRIVLASTGFDGHTWLFQSSAANRNWFGSNLALWTISPDGAVLTLRRDSPGHSNTSQELLIFKRSVENVE